jgi:hypothetical protein
MSLEEFHYVAAFGEVHFDDLRSQQGTGVCAPDPRELRPRRYYINEQGGAFLSD